MENWSLSMEKKRDTKPQKWSFENIPCQKQSNCISIKCVEKNWKLRFIWKIDDSNNKKNCQ